MFSSLRSRILLILFVAIIPPVLVIAAIAWNSYESARAAKIATLGHDAELLASRMDAVPLGAGRLAQTVSSFSQQLGDTEGTCSDRLAGLLSNYVGYDSIAVFRGGTARCEARRRDAPSAATLVTGRDVAGMTAGDVRTGLAETAAGYGVLWIAGRAEETNDIAVVTVDREFLGRLLDVYRIFPSSRAALVDRELKPLAVGRPASDPHSWPSDLPLEVGIGSRIATVGGVATIFTVQKLRSFDVWLVASNLESDILAEPRQQLVVSVLAPLIMLMTAVLAIWLGLNGAVLRWVMALQAANRAHAAEGGATRVGMGPKAPREFLDLAASFDTLTAQLAERNAELERENSEKRDYLRELHHRVKNNLQVIASLLALQKRALPPEQRQILRFPEDRVNAMSAVYRTTYADSETGAVRIAPMIREVIHRLQDVAGASRTAFEMEAEGIDHRVALDTAVPIAMLLAEILPDYIDAAVQHGTTVDVRLIGEPKLLLLEIDGDASVPPRSFKLSRRFVEAYLRQLGATLEEAEPGRVRISCPLDDEADKPRLVKIGGVA